MTETACSQVDRCGIRNQLDVTWCYTYFLYISSSTCFGQHCAHAQELTTQWLYRRVWCSTVAAVGCQNLSAGCVSIEEYVAQLALLAWGWDLSQPHANKAIINGYTTSLPILTAYSSHGTTPHAAI